MKKGQVKRGFKSFRSTVKEDKNGLRRIRNCKTCKFFYPEEGEQEDICHSNSVTKFDIVQEGDLIFCAYWMPSWERDQ